MTRLNCMPTIEMPDLKSPRRKVSIMKRFLGWVTGLVLIAGSVFAAESAPPLTLNDVIRLHAAGVSDDIIMSEIIVTESTFALTADEVIQLKETGLSDDLIQFLIDTRRGRSGRPRRGSARRRDAGGGELRRCLRNYAVLSRAELRLRRLVLSALLVRLLVLRLRVLPLARVVRLSVLFRVPLLRVLRVWILLRVLSV